MLRVATGCGKSSGMIRFTKCYVRYWLVAFCVKRCLLVFCYMVGRRLEETGAVPFVEEETGAVTFIMSLW